MGESVENKPVGTWFGPNTVLQVDRQIDLLMGRYIDSRQTDTKQIDKYIDRQIERQIDRKIDRHIDSQIHRQIDRQIDRKIDRQ